jgi:hypothetical protein
MALKDYIEEIFRSEEVSVLVSLDVEGAFNSAWWPSILKSQRKRMPPKPTKSDETKFTTNIY